MRLRTAFALLVIVAHPARTAAADGGRLVRCQRMVLNEPDEKGRRKPVPVLGTEFDLPINVILVAIGEAP